MKIKTIELIIRLLSRIKKITCFLCKCESHPIEELEKEQEQERVNRETIDHLEKIVEEKFKDLTYI